MKLTTTGRIARNSVAVTGALLLQRASNFVLYILIARHLGVLAFGQFSLVYTFYIIFQVPAMFGLVSLIVREVAKDKSHYSKYLVNGHLIVLISSLLSLGLLILTVNLLGYSGEVIRATYLLGLALIPFAMCKVCEAIFQAFERMQFIVYAFGLADLVKIVLVWLLLFRGFGLLQVLAVLVVIQSVMLIIEWFFIYHYFPRPSWTIDLAFSKKLTRVATTFLGISLFAILFLRVNVIILSKFEGEVAVGFYNAAFQLTYVFMIASRSITDAIYPVLSRTFIDNRVKFQKYAERAVEFLISLAIPLAVGFFFLADIILLVYKEEFVAGAPVLRILVWMLVPLSFERILGGALLASGQQRANLVITMVNTVSIFALGMVLIHRFGLVGAGVALLISVTISFAMHYGLVARRVIRISIPRVVWRPLVAGICLAGFLALAKESYSLPLVLSLSMVLYGAILFSLNRYSGGPFSSLRIDLLRNKSTLRAGSGEI